MRRITIEDPAQHFGPFLLHLADLERWAAKANGFSMAMATFTPTKDEHVNRRQSGSWVELRVTLKSIRFIEKHTPHMTRFDVRAWAIIEGDTELTWIRRCGEAIRAWRLGSTRCK